MSATVADKEDSAGATGAPNVGAATGLFRSLMNLAATLVSIAHTRLELLKVELQEEVQLAANLVVWAFVALLATMIGLFFGGITVVLVYWESHRVLAALLVTAVFVLVAIVAIVVLLRKINSRPPFLDATLNELSKDVQTIKASTASKV
jgi:uncharacterized membrane protein YqjE